MDLDRRTMLLSGLVSGALGATALAATPADAAPTIGRVLAKNLEVPWGVAFLPSGDALVSERINGNIHRVRRTGGRHLVGTVTGLGSNAGEGGLLGLAVASTFPQDRWLYAYLSTSSDNRVVRMKYVNGTIGPQHVILAGIPTETNHNGGRLAFGPEGLLYASTGDALDSSQAQNTDALNGKILRMTPRGEVPAGNPFGNFVWTYGHRNVEGITFDAKGRMWAAEFGLNTRDEMNHIVKGKNYGWPIVEGGDGPGPFKDPFVTWSPTSICSPSGIATAKGRAWVGALHGTALWSVRLDGPHRRHKVRHFYNTFGRIRTVQKAPDGSLWITTSNRDGRGTPVATDDRVIRILV